MTEELPKYKPLLDEVEMKEKTRYGVIDFSNKKQIFFYDLTNDSNPDIRLMLMWWRISQPESRFGEFCAENAPQINLPPMSVILKKGILNLDDLDIPENSKKVTSRSIQRKTEKDDS